MVFGSSNTAPVWPETQICLLDPLLEETIYSLNYAAGKVAPRLIVKSEPNVTFDL